MVENTSQIPEVLNQVWEFFITEFKKNDAEWGNKLINRNVFFEFLKDLYLNPMISKFQWQCVAGELYNLLEFHYFPAFLLKIWNYARKLNLDEHNVSDSLQLKDFFNDQFKIFENEILLSDKFEYCLFIPTFRIHFPENSKEVIFDSNHKIVDISDKDEPYRIKEFKDTPSSWSRRWNHKPNASFEVRFFIKKRSAKEDPYDQRWHPIMPNEVTYNYNIFIEKYRSIFEFFLCYGSEYDLSSLAYGDRFFVKQPPFSSHLRPILPYFAVSEFPPPIYPMYFDKTREDWVQKWKDKYDWFYTTFYEKDPITTNTLIFRYSLEVLRTLSQISIVRVKNFLLISVFEGLLISENEKYKKKILKQLNLPKKTGNSVPAAKAFIKLSESEKNFWQPLFQRNYPLATPLTTFSTKNDLYDFIISSFRYRNTIAHANIGKKLKLKPLYLKPPNSRDPIEFILESFISQYFPHFIIFIIRTWLKYNKTSSQNWMNFILSIL